MLEKTLEKILRFFQFKTNENNVLDDMTTDEKNTIVLFAAGRLDLKQEALEIYNRHLHTIGANGNDFMAFMSEVNNPAPNYAIRGMLRHRVMSEQA